MACGHKLWVSGHKLCEEEVKCHEDLAQPQRHSSLDQILVSQGRNTPSTAALTTF